MAIGNHTQGLPGGESPSVPQALERLVDAAQGVISDQLELTRLEAREAVVGSMMGAVAVLVGATVVLVGWVALSMAAHAVLVQRLVPWQSLCLVAAGNAVVGLAVVGFGVARMGRARRGE